MGVVDRLQETWYRATGRQELAEQVRAERAMVDHLTESIADLEARMYEPGWQRLTAQADQEFSRAGLKQITAVCRVMAAKNPLIKRGLSLRQAYVWGDVEISARDRKVNQVVQEFNDDPGNRRTFTGPGAREELERALGTDGNVFLAAFTNPRTGRVQVRVLPWDEITHVITNPEDASEPWFYRRQWWARRSTGSGVVDEPRVTYYPAMSHQPTARPRTIADQVTGGEVPVQWDAPTVHIAVNRLSGWQFGLPDAYAAIDWAHAYRDFLGDWATLIKSLSRFAWKLTSKGSKQAAAKAKLAAAPSRNPATGEANHAGATASLPPGMALEAIPKSGATIDSESGRPLAAMVAAALDVPVTMLLGDPGVTGARATAETLDTPTEMMAEQRRRIWTEAMRAIYRHVIASSVKASDGLLKGTVTQNGTGGEQLRIRGRAEPTVDIVWPDVDEVAPATLVDAITKADQTSYLPPLVVARLLLQALGVRDTDEILNQMTGPDGEYVPPSVSAGQAAVDAFRRGEDPAAVLAGQQAGQPAPPDPGEG